LNLHQCIADLNTVIIPDLTIVDATLCSLEWELGVKPVRLNTILAGQNVLATDMVAASMLGYRIDEVEHLHLAAQVLLGPASIEKIKIISPTRLKEVPSGQVTGKEPYFHLPGLEVIEKGTCSSCKGAMIAAMRRLSRERRSPSCTILMGQRVREREDKFAFNLKSAKPLVGIGQCCSWVVNNYPGEQIKGCPVRAEAIYRYLRKIS